MQILETVKDHPYATGAVVIGAGAVILFLMSSGDDDSGSVYDGGYMVSGPSDAQVAAGTALQAMQMEFAANREELAAQLKLADITAGAAIEAETIAATRDFNLAQIASDLQKFNITKSAETSMQSNILAASVAEKSINLEAFRIEEASKNTALQVDAAYDIAMYDRTLDFKTDKKVINTAKVLGKKELEVTKTLGKKQLQVTKKLGKISGDVQKDASTKGLIGNIIGGIFSLGSSVITNKTNNAAKSSYMPVETKKDKKKGKNK
jgi:hypothetical protein